MPSISQTDYPTQIKRSPIFDARAYGAVGDGSHDDTAAIQAAINAAGSAGGGIAFLSAGKYKVTSSLNIGNGTSGGQSTTNYIQLVGVGTGTGAAIAAGEGKSGASVLQWYGANSGTMLNVNGPIIGVQVKDLAFDGAPSSNIAGTAMLSMHSYLFRYENLYASGVSGFAYDLEAYENPTGFNAGSGDGIVDGMFTSNLQTTGSGLNVGGTTFASSPHLDVARVAFRNLSFLVGSSGVGLQLRFTDSLLFDQIFTLGGTYGLQVINPGGTNYPSSIQIRNAYFGGTSAPTNTPVGWHPTQASDAGGGLLFQPWGSEIGPAPNVNGVYGFTDQNEYFGFKLYGLNLTLVNGANNDVDIGIANFVHIAGPTGAYNITGFKNGRNGRVLTIVGNTGGVLTISNNNSGSASGNRIAIPGGSDIALSNGTQSATFIYSGADSVWFFVAGK